MEQKEEPMKAIKRMLLAAGVGAAVAHFWDPDRGRGRRTKLRDQTAGKVRRTMRRADRLKRRASSELYGLKQKVEHANGASREPIFFDDVTLADKVRSELLGRRGVPKPRLTIDAHNGTVALRGQVGRPDEIKALERMVREIDGVHKVQNLLHLPETAAPNKAMVRDLAR